MSARIQGPEGLETLELLPRERGVLSLVTSTEFRRELQDFSVNAPTSPKPDLVLLAVANWFLQTDSDDQIRVAAVASKRWELLEPGKIAEPVEVPAAELIRRAQNFLEETGYPGNAKGAYMAAGDIFFGRVTAGQTHPMLGGRCFASFVQGRASSATLNDWASRCDVLWNEWLGSPTDREDLTARMKAIAIGWFKDQGIRDRPGVPLNA